MKSALNNTEAYGVGVASVWVIRRLSFSRRFLVAVVTVVTIMVFFVNADHVVMAQALIVVGIFFPCIMHLSRAITEFSVEKGYHPEADAGSHRGSRPDPNGPPAPADQGDLCPG